MKSLFFLKEINCESIENEICYIILIKEDLASAHVNDLKARSCPLLFGVSALGLS